jgi:hypothetical protein
MGSQPYFASRRQRLENARVGVERLVGDQHIAIHTGQGVVHSQQVVRFTAGRQTSRRVAERTDKAWILLLSLPRESPVA